MFPDYLQQGLGFTPVDDSLAGAPDPYGGLHPAVAQGLGLMPPPPPPVQTPPIDQPVQLPSAAQPATPQPPVPSRDFQVPASAIDGPGTKPAAPARPAAPPKPQTPEQGFAAAAQQRQSAERDAEAAVQQQLQAAAPMHAEELAAAQRHQENIDKTNQQQKELNDAMNKEAASARQITEANNKAIDDYKIDRSKYWKDSGVGTHIGWYIAMAMSGLGDAMQGKSGPNPVIQMLQDKNREAIIAQLDAREQLKEKRTRDVQTHMENVQGFQSRQAEILRQQGQFDRALANDIDLAARKAADPMDQARAATLIAGLHQSSADKQEAAIEKQASYAVQNRQVAIAGGHLGLAQKQFEWQKDKDQQALDLEAAKLAQKGDPKATEAYQKFGVAGVTNKDGSPYMAQGTPEGVERVREKKAATMTMVGLFDKALRIRTGYSSSIDDRNEWQRIKQLWGAAKAKGKDALGLGALSESDYELLDGYLGSDDPTAFRDPSAGIRQARETAMGDLNDTLKSHDLSGNFDKFTITDTSSPPAPVKTTEDESLADALNNPKRAYDDKPGRLTNELGKPADTESLSSLLEKQGNILPSVRQNIQTWGAMLNSGDVAISQRARTMLETVAEKSESPEQAALARQLLERNMTESAFRGGEPERIRGPGGVSIPIGGNP